MSDPVPESEGQIRACTPRPVAISLTCVVWTVTLGMGAGMTIRFYRAGYMPIDTFAWYVAFWVASGVSLVGLWQMKRWGVHSALAYILIGACVNAFGGTLLPVLSAYAEHWPQLIYSLLVITVMLYYYRRMD